MRDIQLEAPTTNTFLVSSVSGDAMTKEKLPDLYEASVTDLQAELDAEHFSSVDLVKAYFARTEEVNANGPEIRAVIELNPFALEQAAVLDKERKETGKRSLLHGIPVLVKDNIATMFLEGMNTTAGSYALLGSVVPDDAGVIKRLREAGAIILGKANMSEWAHYRGGCASGWSGRGGQCTNAYYPGANPGGSSSGSGVAASIGLAAVTLGTETNGSICSPSSNNNIVGIKPTVGLTSRAGVIPISINQDTVGPMARSVEDAAIVLSLISGTDPNDQATFSQPATLPDFTKALNKDALRGKRIGVPRHRFLNNAVVEYDPYVKTIFEQALQTMRDLGATIVDPADLPSADEIVNMRGATIVMSTDFKMGIKAYLQSLVKNPSGVQTLADIIAFNDAHPDTEKPPGYDSQDLLIKSDTTDGHNDEYLRALDLQKKAAGARGIDAALKIHNLDALVLPARGISSTPAALCGYPIVTGTATSFNFQIYVPDHGASLSVPLGFFPEDVTMNPEGPLTMYPAPGVPFGINFFGTAWSEYDLISFAYAYEQKTQTRLARRAYDGAIPRTQLVDVIGKPQLESGLN